MNDSATKHFRSYRPLRRRIEKHAKVLSQAGFRILDGSDSGWFGDGRYLLGNDTQLMRITRSRGEEFLEVAFNKAPAEEQWFGVAELMVAFGVVTYEDVVSNHAIPHDLDFKVDAYRRRYPSIDKELVQDRIGLEHRLNDVRRREMKDAQEMYGRAHS
jgi:hypothetical protein